MKVVPVTLGLISLGLASVAGAAAGEACLLAWTSTYCVTSDDPVDCICFGAAPPVEGYCSGDYETGVEGIWNPEGCPGGGANCTLFTVSLERCSTKHLCRRVDNINHTHCLSTSDCQHWISYTYAYKYEEAGGVCNQVYKPI
ncbi:MAG: hypothetical protein ABIG44_08190 [Planctomycetota bacterium]